MTVLKTVCRVRHTNGGGEEEGGTQSSQQSAVCDIHMGVVVVVIELTTVCRVRHTDVGLSLIHI